MQTQWRGSPSSELLVLSSNPQPVPEKVVLVGCGGLTIQPKCICELDIGIYGSKFVVPTFLVPANRDELIIGSKVIRPIMPRMKTRDIVGWVVAPMWRDR